MMLDDTGDRQLLEENHAHIEHELRMKLDIHEEMVKDDFESMVKGEARRRIKIYEDMGLRPDAGMYEELRGFFVKLFACTVVELFEGAV